MQFFIFVNLSLFVIYLSFHVLSIYFIALSLSLPRSLSLPFNLSKLIAHPVCEGLGGVEIRARCSLWASKMSFRMKFCSSLEGTVVFFHESHFPLSYVACPLNPLICEILLWKAFFLNVFSGEITNCSFLMTCITMLHLAEQIKVDSDVNYVGPLWIMIFVFRERPENLLRVQSQTLWIMNCCMSRSHFVWRLQNIEILSFKAVENIFT